VSPAGAPAIYLVRNYGGNRIQTSNEMGRDEYSTQTGSEYVLLLEYPTVGFIHIQFDVVGLSAQRIASLMQEANKLIKDCMR
jgi:hypothetical protein